MAADESAEHSNFRRMAADEELVFLVNLRARLAASIDHADRADSRPARQGGYLGRRLDDMDLAAFPATMRFLEADVSAETGNLIVRFAVLNELLEQGVVQRLLVAFDHQNVVGVRMSDGRGRFHL